MKKAIIGLRAVWVLAALSLSGVFVNAQTVPADSAHGSYQAVAIAGIASSSSNNGAVGTYTTPSWTRYFSGRTGHYLFPGTNTQYWYWINADGTVSYETACEGYPNGAFATAAAPVGSASVSTPWPAIGCAQVVLSPNFTAQQIVDGSPPTSFSVSAKNLYYSEPGGN